MSTKEKILETSRHLFNTQGLAATPVRAICEAMAISAGNFSYHYPNKDQIVIDLYTRMQEEIQEGIANMELDTRHFRGYLETHRLFFEIQTKYKFFYLNLFEIMTHYPAVKTAYLKTIQHDKLTARRLLQQYQEHGVIRKHIAEDYLDRALQIAHILDTAWLTEAEISFKGNEKKKLKYYLGICCSLIEPFLTEKSLKEYRLYFEEIG